MEWGSLTEKKLQQVRLAGNPLADPRIRRFVDGDAPSMVKDLLNHVRKHGFKVDAGGGKKGKKGKKAAATPSGSEDEGEDNIADLLAAMAKGSDDELD